MSKACEEAIEQVIWHIEHHRDPEDPMDEQMQEMVILYLKQELELSHRPTY